MPLINVTLGSGRTGEQKKALMSALTEAAVESIGAPRDSIRVWINEVDPATEYMAAGETLADKQARLAREKTGS